MRTNLSSTIILSILYSCSQASLKDVSWSEEKESSISYVASAETDDGPQQAHASTANKALENPKEIVSEDLLKGHYLLKRLTVFEFRNQLLDQFGINISSTLGNFPQEASVSGFKNHIDAFKTSIEHVRWFFNNAATVAEKIITDAPQEVVGCLAETKIICLEQLILKWAQLLYRRPVSVEESDRIKNDLTLFLQQTKSRKKALHWSLEILLQSPNTLFRFSERSKQDQLDPITLASNLAFFVWHSAPDEELLNAAINGTLTTEEELAHQTKRMLKDSKAKRGVRRFVSEWLQLSRLDSIELDSNVYKKFKPENLPLIKKETIMFFENILFGSDSFMKVFNASYTPDPALAELYTHDNETNPVDLQTTRAGFLTQLAFLNLTSVTSKTDPVARGHYISEKFLCVKTPIPPAGITNLPEVKAGVSKKQRLEQHRADPGCNGCHIHMDPLGMPFESYDMSGVYRMKDEFQMPVESFGEYIFNGELQQFSDAIEFGNMLANSPEAKKCFVKRVAEYAFGRDLSSFPETIDWLLHKLDQGNGNYQELIVAIATSKSFRGIP